MYTKRTTKHFSQLKKHGGQGVKVLRQKGIERQRGYTKSVREGTQRVSEKFKLCQWDIKCTAVRVKVVRHKISERDHQSQGAKMNVQTQTECQRDTERDRERQREAESDRERRREAERGRERWREAQRGTERPESGEEWHRESWRKTKREAEKDGKN